MRRPSRLGMTLRAIVLSTPFVNAVALPGCCLEVTAGLASDGGPDAGDAGLARDAGPDAGDAGVDAGIWPPCADGGFEQFGPLPQGYVPDGPPSCDLCPTQNSVPPCAARDCALCSNGGTLAIGCDFYACGGRRPARFVPTLRSQATFGSVARYWSDIARLESASVVAFRDFESELRAHGAPGALLRAARRAARDEIRHARLTAALCRKHGGRPAGTTFERSKKARSLRAVARENAVEGCVRETFGALVGLWQAQHAGDAATRRAMASIAVDETRHAELAWSMAAWSETRLDASARRQVRVAQRAAFAELLRSVEQPVAEEVVTVAGLPHPVAARRLAQQMGAALNL